MLTNINFESVKKVEVLPLIHEMWVI